MSFNLKTELFADEELNKFVFGKKVNHYKSEFFRNAEKAYRTIFTEYEPIVEPAGLNLKIETHYVPFPNLI